MGKNSAYTVKTLVNFISLTGNVDDIYSISRSSSPSIGKILLDGDKTLESIAKITGINLETYSGYSNSKNIELRK